ncbi:hypothetical protein [Pseudonocardia sp. MH-G8]|uniref:hypothetical protein n=1 Tax=Pseudonocardia sp. MH-G8 TaxID=1854588 RepID=UPI000B9FF6ED|nr:hypothetical protein [Pseudonocardia sp. MH-G8]OZM77768.1 hypothetical protein CFP66_33930 [Pseudonocardia sp. MH-G8]
MTRLYPGEPAAGPWRAVPVEDVLDLLGRPRVLAVDGRSGGGKTTVSHRVAAAVPGATVLHTDDVAWYESFIHWAEWQAAEDPFQTAQLPRERAGLVVSGAPQLPHDPHRELVVARPSA